MNMEKTIVMKRNEEDGWKIVKIKPVEVAFGNLKLQ